MKVYIQFRHLCLFTKSKQTCVCTRLVSHQRINTTCNIPSRFTHPPLRQHPPHPFIHPTPHRPRNTRVTRAVSDRRKRRQQRGWVPPSLPCRNKHFDAMRRGKTLAMLMMNFRHDWDEGCRGREARRIRCACDFYFLSYLLTTLPIETTARRRGG